jgi:hypothetical protein
VTPCTRGAREAWRADGVTRDFTFRGKLYRYPGPGGWHFVDIGRKHAGALRARPKETKVGWGYIPVRARIGKSEWRTTLFSSKEGRYLLAVKKSVRAAEGLGDGDTVTVAVHVL